MFANATKQVGISQRVVTTLVACATILFSIGVYQVAHAANLVEISNTLSDSDLNVTSAHTIQFEIPTGSTLTSGQTVSFTFDAGFTAVSTVVSGDITATVDGGAPVTIAGFSATGQVVSFTGIAATAGQVVVVAIADGKIVNPNAVGSLEVNVVAGSDTGATEVAIIDNVVVTASIDTQLVFTIDGLATSTSVNSETTTGSSTPTLLDFGEVSSAAPSVLGQTLSVTTNAFNGFVVTVQSDQELSSPIGADIDTFIDGTDVSTPTAWTLPTPIVTDENTWGHWGVTTNDVNLNSGNNFGASEFIAVSSTTPRELFSHDGPADGTTQNIGTADVAYKIAITGLQEAADDYTTTLTYVATPTF